MIYQKKKMMCMKKILKFFTDFIYRKMMNEAIKMAAEILLDHGRHPTDQDFEEKSNNLVKTILEKKNWYVG